MKIAVAILLFMGIWGIVVSEIANSMLMLGVGASFIVIALLKYTPLKFLVPIGDSIIVFFIAVMVIIDTSKLFIKTISIIGGKGIVGEEKKELLNIIRAKVSNEINIKNLRLQKKGKTVVVVVELKDENIKRTKIKDISNIIKDSVSEKYEINQTTVSFV